MKSLASLSSANRNFWLTVLVLIISIVLEFYGRAGGFHLTPDSHQYLLAAESFSRQRIFLGLQGDYYVQWPPLFPIILSTSSNPLVLLIGINIVCKIIIVATLFFLAHRYLKIDFYQSIFLIISSLSVYILMISVFLWTELLFLTLIFLNLYFALHVKKKIFFWGLIVTGFLLCIQRNAGLFWISGLSIWFMVGTQDSFQKRSARTLVFFLVSTSGFWAWNIYNALFIPAKFSFYDHSFLDGFGSNILLMIGTFAKMIAPVQAVLLQVLIFGFLVCAILYCIDQPLKNIFLITVTVYSAAFTVLGRLNADEMDRYLSVMTPFVFLMVLIATEKIARCQRKWLRYCIMTFAIVWMSYTLIRTVKNVQFWHERSRLTDSRR